MATRREICEAFTIAKRLTARNREECTWGFQRYEFICHALKKLGHLPGADAAIKIIQERFKTDDSLSTTIYAWLYDVAGVRSGLLTDDNVQAYKHRWLDSVIKEFSK
jgi:hypothetical protein